MKALLANKLLLAVVAVVVVGGGVFLAASGKDDDTTKTSSSSSTSEAKDKASDTSSNSNQTTSDKKTALGPGTSINPIDKDKSFSSDTFKYTLLDVRTDTVDDVYKQYGADKVYLVKLEVERIANDSTVEAGKKQAGLSVAEVSLVPDNTNPQRNPTKNYESFKNDLYYSRSKVGVDLGGDIKELKLGEKVTGYYIFDAEKPAHTTVTFAAFNFSGMSVEAKTFSKQAGTFKIK